MSFILHTDIFRNLFAITQVHPVTVGPQVHPVTVGPQVHPVTVGPHDLLCSQYNAVSFILLSINCGV
jgi:hypothetical protein